MLTIKNKVLSNDSKITNAVSILKLYSDIDCNVIGVITFKNSTSKTLQFIKENDYFKARVCISQEELNILDGATLHIILIDCDTTQTTNKIPLEFDKLQIKQSLIRIIDSTTQDILTKLNQLSKKVNDLTLSKTIKELNISDLSYVKAGMIPVTIDDKGTCMYQYPFADIVNEINGQKAVDRVILLTAKDIPYGKSSTIEDTLIAQAKAMKSLNAFMQDISAQVKNLTKEVADVKLKLIKHTDSSII